MINFDEMFKQVESELDKLPPELRGSIKKLHSDSMKVATNTNMSQELKRAELQHLHNKFNIENGIKTNK